MNHLRIHIACQKLIFTIEIQRILLVNKFWKWNDNLEKLTNIMAVFLSKIGLVRFLLLHGQSKKGCKQWWVLCRRSMILWSATSPTSEKRICKCYFNNKGYIFFKIFVKTSLQIYFNTFLSNSHLRLHGGPSQSTNLDAWCLGYHKSYRRSQAHPGHKSSPVSSAR